MKDEVGRNINTIILQIHILDTKTERKEKKKAERKEMRKRRGGRAGEKRRQKKRSLEVGERFLRLMILRPCFISCSLATKMFVN
jgi:hypothetical protein